MDSTILVFNEPWIFFLIFNFTRLNIQHNSAEGQLRAVGIRPYYLSARRADRSRQRPARMHTVGFGLAEGRRPNGQGTWGVAEVMRFKIDGGVL